MKSSTWSMCTYIHEFISALLCFEEVNVIQRGVVVSAILKELSVREKQRYSYMYTSIEFRLNSYLMTGEHQRIAIDKKTTKHYKDYGTTENGRQITFRCHQ